MSAPSLNRDLKPKNILLDNAGHIRIANFSVAVTGVIGFRMVSGFAGTPRFMAPEVCNVLSTWWLHCSLCTALNSSLLFTDILTLPFFWIFLQIFLDQPYNWTVDYFSLGIMVFLMATGRHPFSSCLGMWKVTTCFHYPYYPQHMEPDLQDLIRTVSISEL